MGKTPNRDIYKYETEQERKEAQQKINKIWRANNKEKIKAMNRKQYVKRKMLLDYDRECGVELTPEELSKKEQRKIKAKIWRDNNKETIKARNRAYQIKKKEKLQKEAEQKETENDTTD